MRMLALLAVLASACGGSSGLPEFSSTSFGAARGGDIDWIMAGGTTEQNSCGALNDYLQSQQDTVDSQDILKSDESAIIFNTYGGIPARSKIESSDYVIAVCTKNIESECHEAISGEITAELSDAHLRLDLYNARFVSRTADFTESHIGIDFVLCDDLDSNMEEILNKYNQGRIF